MLKRKVNERTPERKEPGEEGASSCSPGSIEQQLDMCESGSLRGEDVLRNTARTSSPNEPYSEEPMDLQSQLNTFDMSMAERDREGDDLSGDEHSSGLQGEEQELGGHMSRSKGIPGGLKNEEDEFENIVDIHQEKIKRKQRKNHEKDEK